MDPTLTPLTAAETRVLGSLIEKAITTPDYYPLSLNALTNACNQLTNREPVVSFDENEILRAIEGLRAQNLATLFQGGESRVAKYKHAFTDAFLLTPAEVAVLCVLMLRGPQTVGELRTRTERLHAFENLADVEATLQGLASRRPNPLVARLPRQPGTKESRHAQLLSGPVATEPEGGPQRTEGGQTPSRQGEAARIEKLESEVAALKQEVAELRQTLAVVQKRLD